MPQARRVMTVEDINVAPAPNKVHERVLLLNPDGTPYSQDQDGYEFTGGFTDRGGFVSYTSEHITNDQWLRFGFDRTSQVANDVAYWSDPDPSTNPNFDQSKGVFGGIHLPQGVSSLVDYDFVESPGYSEGVLGESLNYTGATGSYDFSDCKPGNYGQVRFDFNIKPQVPNTTVEVALIFQTRDSEGATTFTFPLTTSPIFYGLGTVAKTYLNRQVITAYFASNEDVYARALPAIKADNPVEIEPITTLVRIES